MGMARIWSHCWKGSVHTPPSTGNHLRGSQNHCPWDRLCPILLTPQVFPKPDGPGRGQPSYILPHSTVTTQFHSLLHNIAYQKAELSRETGRFLGASGISLRMPKEHFTKRQITWSLFSSLSWSHHLKCTTQILSLLGSGLGTFFFSFLFSSRESEPGMLRWKDGSLLAALKILPNHTLFS